jgi:hypothetical protein
MLGIPITMENLNCSSKDSSVVHSFIIECEVRGKSGLNLTTSVKSNTGPDRQVKIYKNKIPI